MHVRKLGEHMNSGGESLSGHSAQQIEFMGERLIYVNEDDKPIGHVEKFDAHFGRGCLHRAFSLLVFDSSNRLLLQKRSSDKITFPGIWANTCCSHPLNNDEERNGFEGSIKAAIRKMEQELGVDTTDLRTEMFVPASKMLYMSRMDEEWVEKELDHIIILRSDLVCSPNPNEVEEIKWVSKEELQEFLADSKGEIIAPWFRLIAERLLPEWWDDLDSVSDDGLIHNFGRIDLVPSPIIGETLEQAVARCRPRVEELLVQALNKTSVPRLRNAMMHLIEGGGKRLRATLPRLVGEALDMSPENEDLEFVGAALEVIHNFTLVHDDIMDDDEIRRGRPAVHIAYDVPTAINAGDAMLAIGFELLVERGNIAPELLSDVILDISSMVRKVSEGQQLDIAFENEENIGVAEYMLMIEGKTAIMFQTAARLGALLSGARGKIVDACTNWGLQMGMCFQLMDDLIDVLSDGTTLGKPRGSDIAQGKKTLMVLHALEQQGDDVDLLKSILGKGENATQDELDSAIGALERLGSIQYARETAESCHRAAHMELDRLPYWAELSVLRELTDWQIQRIS